MALYKLNFKQSVVKQLRKIANQDVKKIISKIQSLSHDPRPMNAVKLAGKDLFRVRQGDYRIVYQVIDKECIIWIVAVGHCKDVYERLAKYH